MWCIEFSEKLSKADAANYRYTINVKAKKIIGKVIVAKTIEGYKI